MSINIFYPAKNKKKYEFIYKLYNNFTFSSLFKHHKYYDYYNHMPPPLI